MTDVLHRLDAIERRVGLGKFSPARELNRRQIREAHGKRVMAREAQNGYGAYGWREGLATPLRDLRSDKDVED